MIPIYHIAHQGHDVAFVVLLCLAIIPSETSLIDLRRDPLSLEEKRACVRHHLSAVSILQKRIIEKGQGIPRSACFRENWPMQKSGNRHRHRNYRVLRTD